MNIKHTLKEGNMGELILCVNKQMTRCPYTPPFQVQGIGGMGMANIPCSTLCPHVSLIEDEGRILYMITCGGSTVVSIEIEDDQSGNTNPEPPVKKSPLSLV